MNETLKTKWFDNLPDLVRFVNKKHIPRTLVQDIIVRDADSMFCLLYWEISE